MNFCVWRKYNLKLQIEILNAIIIFSFLIGFGTKIFLILSPFYVCLNDKFDSVE